DKNGRRTLRAGAAGLDGTLTYDTANNPTGTKWTATYPGMSAADVLRAVGGTSSTGVVIPAAESRALWLGRVPLALLESTIFENGPGVVGGPSAPCLAPAETPVAAATFTPTAVGFPGTAVTTPATTSAARTITLSNAGGAPMTITDVYVAGLTPGDFARSGGSCPTVFPASLASGASCTVLVTFAPSAVGLRQANLSVSDNAANTTDQTVALTGTGNGVVNPIVTPTPATLAFGTVNGGASASLPVLVTNTGGGPLAISAFSIAGTAAADFTVTSQTCTAAPVAAGAGCTITVQFKPGARAPRSATLTLAHNTTAGGATSTAIPLSGTGGTGAALTLSPNPVTFGTVNRNTSKDQTVSVKNGGNAAAALTLASFAVTGTGYTVRSTTCANLAVNNSCNVVLRFTAPNVVANFNGTLSVTATNGLPATVTASLTATGK
ncbi:MAG: trimeric autotransporter adhesin, partial [Chloroflexota bacterium]|nr:trimeric autotransporter adhesin [Chloroflexota bacterium]